MTYGPYHNVRCRDDIAAAMLGESDDEQRRAVSSEAEPDDQSCGHDDAPSFLSDTESNASALTGPAAPDDQRTP